MRLRADRAELVAGPRRAASLAALDLRRVEDRQNGGDWTASARLLERDAFWSSQEGQLDLVVALGRVRWVWRGVRVAWGGGRVAIVGSGWPEVRNA